MKYSYDSYKDKTLHGRYINKQHLKSFEGNMSNNLYRTSLSEEGRSISCYKLGEGDKKILIWSQMHGNESTGTKALIDVSNLLFTNVNKYFPNVSIYFVPMLNPDGSEVFTRVNARGVDLNRDAVNYVSKELKFLKSLLDDIQPDYCINLHDQRNIFNPTGSSKPATISFLAPSENESREITTSRIETMKAISYVYDKLKMDLPDQIGRYSDEFYPTATGDNFQKMGYPTILVEAGHYPGDLPREKTRYFNFLVLVYLLEFVNNVADAENAPYKSYFTIPENDNKCFDFIDRNVEVSEGKFTDVGYLYDFELVNGVVVPYLKKMKSGDLSNYISFRNLS